MEDSLGWLISDTARLLRRRFDERARLIGATRPQWRALAMVARNEGINQGGLAERLEVEPITACRMIDRLEEAGLVERRRDPADRRAWQLFLTRKAKPMIDDLREIGNTLSVDALDGVAEQERAILFAALTAIRANLSDPAQEGNVANG